MSLTAKSASQWLEQIQGKRVLVVGDVGVDRYTQGTVERISPEAPVPVVWVQEEKLKLGLAANVADNIRALGGEPLLVGVVGKDRTAVELRGLLEDVGISSSHLVVDDSRRTVLKERVVSERQQLLRIDYESAGEVEAPIRERLAKKVRSLLTQVDAVIIEDYAKGLFSPASLRALTQAVKRAKLICAIDPNVKTQIDAYRGATVLTPNSREAESLSGIKITDEASLARVGAALLKRTGAKHVVITRGKDGMALVSAGSKSVVSLPTFAREVYDVSGAGDTVISVLTLALTAGASLEDAASLANVAAGVEVGKRGTATVTCDEIRAALRR